MATKRGREKCEGEKCVSCAVLQKPTRALISSGALAARKYCGLECHHGDWE